MKQKTSFQIWDDVEVNKNNKTISEFNKEVWVRTEEIFPILQDIIKDLVNKRYNDKLYNLYKEISVCNSQEQKKFKDNPRTPKSDIADEQGRASVSCEHNTGKDNEPQRGESFPVQNPKIVNNPLGAVDDILKCIPKKCTCLPIRQKYESDLKHKVCGCCGGEL